MEPPAGEEAEVSELFPVEDPGRYSVRYDKYYRDREIRALSYGAKRIVEHLIHTPSRLIVPGVVPITIEDLCREMAMPWGGIPELDFTQSRDGVDNVYRSLSRPFPDLFREASRNGKIRYNEEARCIWLPEAVRYQKPKNPDQAKGWARALTEHVDESDFLDEIARGILLRIRMATGNKPTFVKAFIEGLPPPMRRKVRDGVETVSQTVSTPVAGTVSKNNNTTNNSSRKPEDAETAEAENPPPTEKIDSNFDPKKPLDVWRWFQEARLCHRPGIQPENLTPATERKLEAWHRSQWEHWENPDGTNQILHAIKLYLARDKFGREWPFNIFVDENVFPGFLKEAASTVTMRRYY